MPFATNLSTTQKSAYKRPYKSRQQRREADRRKYDGTNDSKFLTRVFIGVALVAAVALAFVLRGSLGPAEPAPTTEMVR